jgi:tetratricopeptide (TPR) repeat protein
MQQVPSTHAQAPEGDVTADAEARSLFDAGRIAFDSGRYAAALDYFERSYALSGRTELLYNLAVACERLRRDQPALDHYEAYLARAPDSERAELVRSRIAFLRAAQKDTANARPASAAAPLHERPAQATRSWQPRVGWSLFGSGMAALAAGWASYGLAASSARKLDRTAPTDSAFLSRQGRVVRGELAAGALGLSAGGLASAALPLLVHRSDAFPLWALASGVAGAGTVAAAAVLLARDARELDDAGTRAPTHGLGVLLLGHALPLLTLPAVYAFRGAGFAGQPGLRATLHGSGAELSLSGAF